MWTGRLPSRAKWKWWENDRPARFHAAWRRPATVDGGEYDLGGGYPVPNPGTRWILSSFTEPTPPPPADWKAPVLALGNFDGLHRGHMKIIERVHRPAVERGATPVVLTFDPHPTRVLRPEKAPRVLMTEAQKVEAYFEKVAPVPPLLPWVGSHSFPFDSE